MVVNHKAYLRDEERVFVKLNGGSHVDGYDSVKAGEAFLIGLGHMRHFSVFGAVFTGLT